MGKLSKDKFKVYQGVFDEFTLSALEVLKRKRYFDKLGGPIKTGKEGDVYFAKKDEDMRALKIYRITSANFKKISAYIVRDYRFKGMTGNLRKVILAWAQKEFRNLSLCHKAQMNVPFPYKQYQNVIVMEYVEGLMLKDTELDDPAKFFSDLKEQLKIMLHEVKLVHGDLSEFNILVKDQKPFIIDLGQGMLVRNEDDFNAFSDLYNRDIANIVKYFNNVYKLKIDEEKLKKELIPKFQ